MIYYILKAFCFFEIILSAAIMAGAAWGIFQ
jgi:hypothetical protein